MNKLALSAMALLLAGSGAALAQNAPTPQPGAQTPPRAGQPAAPPAGQARNPFQSEPLGDGPWEVQSADARLHVEVLTKGLDHPWGLAFLPNGDMLVTERPGRLRLVRADGSLDPTPISGLPPMITQGIAGLTDIVLDPGFATNRTLYLSYSKSHPDAGANPTPQANSANAVLRARWDGGTSLKEVEDIFVARPWYGAPPIPQRCCGQGPAFGSYGGRMAIDKDGHLYVTSGDRNYGELVQDQSNHIGKILRLNRDGSVPRDNPFVGRSDALPEIWSYGHRNIQGMTLHPSTGVVWLHEHGAKGGDEINIPERGKNYGWPVIAYGVHYSGQKIGIGTEAPGMEQPLLHWTPSIAPAGMAFYTGDKIPAWKGNLFAGSLVFRSIQRVMLEGTRVVGQERIELGSNIRDVRDGPDGFLYVVTDSAEGRILRLERAS